MLNKSYISNDKYFKKCWLQADPVFLSEMYKELINSVLPAYDRLGFRK